MTSRPMPQQTQQHNDQPCFNLRPAKPFVNGLLKIPAVNCVKKLNSIRNVVTFFCRKA
jgi:hypothetical protein